MVLVSHEELITNQDFASWELNGGQHVEDPSKSLCQRLWGILNSKTANSLIILATLLEAVIILAELLIDLRIIQDPYAPSLCNITSSGDSSDIQDTLFFSSRNLHITKEVLAYSSVALLALFLFEILLRILAGKRKYLTQGAELFDGVVVVLVFSLDLAFLITSKDNSDGKVAAEFIILLRLWRINRLVQSIVHEAKREMGHIINAYKRDKIQAEHKVEILILKVEDLEHEVAYLKERLKKTEKEAATQKKRKGRDFGPEGEPKSFEETLHLFTNPKSPHDATPWKSVPVLSFAPLPSPTIPSHRSLAQPPFSKLSPNSPGNGRFTTGLHSPLASSPAAKLKSPRRRKSQGEVAELQDFAVSQVDRILQSASMELDTISEEGVREKRTLRVEQHDSGRGSSLTPGSTPRVTTLQRDEHESGRESPLYTVPGNGLFDQEQPSKEDETASHIKELDELSEIERVKKVEFNAAEDSMDIPVTAL